MTEVELALLAGRNLAQIEAEILAPSGLDERVALRGRYDVDQLAVRCDAGPVRDASGYTSIREPMITVRSRGRPK